MVLMIFYIDNLIILFLTIIIIINDTLARSLEPVVTECKEHTIHTQTQIVASRKPKEIKHTRRRGKLHHIISTKAPSNYSNVDPPRNRRTTPDYLSQTRCY